MPLTDDDDDDDGCGSVVELDVSTVHVPDSPSAAILAPYQHPPTPHPSPSQHPHATVPVSHQSQTHVLGTILGIVVALVAFCFAACYVVRRRRIATDPFEDPPQPRFTAFRLRRSIASKKRLSDESWVSPVLSSPLSQDLEPRQHRRLIPVTTPVCTPTDTEFGSRLEFAHDDFGQAILVPPVRVPSPVYISPFSPSPSPSLSSSASLSPALSTDPLTSPPPSPARLSRLLSSTFTDTPARPTTAHLIQTARSYAYAYRPSSVITTSLYTPPTRSIRLSGTRSRTSFYPGQTGDVHGTWSRVRDTFSTVTTSDTDTVCTVPHLVCAVSEVEQRSASPFADSDRDPRDENGCEWPVSVSCPGQSASIDGRTETRAPVGTPLGLKLRLSDASEHARYRSRERERERQRTRERVKERAESQLSIDSRTSASTAVSIETVHADHRRLRSLEMRNEFKLRDSESVLREIGW